METAQKWIKQCLDNKNNTNQTTSSPPSLKIHKLSSKPIITMSNTPKSYHTLNPSKQRKTCSRQHKIEVNKKINTISKQKEQTNFRGPYAPKLSSHSSRQDSKLKVVSKITSKKVNQHNQQNPQVKRQLLLKQSKMRINNQVHQIEKSNNFQKKNLTISIQPEEEQSKEIMIAKTSKHQPSKQQELYITPCFTPQQNRYCPPSGKSYRSTSIGMNINNNHNFYKSQKVNNSTQIKTISSFNEPHKAKNNIHRIDSIFAIKKLAKQENTKHFSSRLQQIDYKISQNYLPRVKTNYDQEDTQKLIEIVSQYQQRNKKENSQQSAVNISISSSQMQIFEHMNNQKIQVNLLKFGIHSQGRYMVNHFAKLQPLNFVFLYREVTPIVMKNNYLQHKIRDTLEICSRISHPNILKIYYAYLYNSGNIAVCVEIAENNLYTLLKKNKKGIQQKLIKKILKQVLNAISFLHHFINIGIVHSNLKPNNIFFINDSVKIQWLGYEDSVISPYTAPEIRRGAPPCKKSDIWSIGVITYLMAYGQLPQWLVQQIESSYSQFSEQRIQGTPIDNLVSKFTISKTSQKAFEPFFSKFEVPIKPKQKFFEGMLITQSKQLSEVSIIQQKRTISNQLKDFIFRTMSQNQFERMTALECLNHPFLNQITKKNQ